ILPDSNFEQRLIDLNIDSDGIVNGQITLVDAHGVVELFLSGANINNLSGLEYFVNLEKLNCHYNPLNGNSGSPYGIINVSTMRNLKELDVRASHLNNINVSS